MKGKVVENFSRVVKGQDSLGKSQNYEGKKK